MGFFYVDSVYGLCIKTSLSPLFVSIVFVTLVHFLPPLCLPLCLHFLPLCLRFVFYLSKIKFFIKFQFLVKQKFSSCFVFYSNAIGEFCSTFIPSIKCLFCNNLLMVFLIKKDCFWFVNFLLLLSYFNP